MDRVLWVCVLVAGAAAYDSTVYGIDVSIAVSQSQFECLKAANLTFAVARAAIGTLQAAQAAGVSAGAYIFPCPRCSTDCGTQAKDAVQELRANSAPFDRIWLDIEGGSTYWHSDSSQNQQCFQDMIAALKGLGVEIGVYTSLSQWPPIMGSSYDGGSDYPLWYAAYDGEPDFDDFKPFNGWSAPAIKQFSDQGSKCGTSYDVNWYPPGHPPM